MRDRFVNFAVMYSLIKKTENDLGIPFRWLIIVSFVLHLTAVYFNVGFMSPDEHYQIIEFADYKLGVTPKEDLHWEFHGQVRPAIQPAIAYVIFKAADFIGISSPFNKAMILRLISSVFSFFIMLLITVYSLNYFNSVRLKKYFIYLSLFIWYIPLLNGRFNSETWSGSLFFAGLMLTLLADKFKRKNLVFVISGILIGFGFWFRFQVGLAVFGYGMWLLFIKKADFKIILAVTSGFIIAVLISALTDIWFYGDFVFTPYRYFKVNILEDIASNYGVSPFYYYFTEFIAKVAPLISVFLIAGIILSFIRFPKNIFVWAVLPFILGHSVIAHKEIRFLYPMCLALPLLALIGFDGIRNVFYWKLRNFLKGWKEKLVIGFLVFENIIGLLIVVIIPTHESVNFFKYIYTFNPGKKTEIFTLNVNPYRNNLGKPNFYINKNIEFIKLESVASLDSVLQAKKEEILFFGTNYMLPDSLQHLNVKTERYYVNVPEFLINFNFNNWMERSYIWSLHSIKKNN